MMQTVIVTSCPSWTDASNVRDDYEGTSIWAAITVIRTLVAEGRVPTLWVMEVNTRQYILTAIEGKEFAYSSGTLKRLLPLLFAPPSDEEKSFEVNTQQILVSVLEQSGIFNHTDYRNDLRHNELRIGARHNETGEKTDLYSVHIFAKTLVDLPEESDGEV
jgi:hypothetical protein